MADSPRKYCDGCGAWGHVDAYWDPPVKSSFSWFCSKCFVKAVEKHGPSAK